MTPDRRLRDRPQVYLDGDVGAPPAGKLRHKVATDQGMKLKEERVVERDLLELAIFDLLFQHENIARQMRRKLAVTQDAEACFDVVGAVSRRVSSARSISSSTGSPSKAMLSATLSGIRLRRMWVWCSGGRARQCWIASFQFMHRIICLQRRILLVTGN